MKKKYLLLVGILAVCFVMGGCKKKSEADKVTAEKEPTIITKDDSVSGQVVEMEQGSNIDKSKITNIMGTKTAASGELVITNLTGHEISEFYARLSTEEDWGEDYVAGKFTLKNSDMALFYYEKDEQASADAAVQYDLRIVFADGAESECYFRELTLSDIEELSLNITDGVPYVKYQSLSSKQQVSTLSAARKRMGLPESASGNETDSSSKQTPGVTGSGTGTNSNTGTGSDGGGSSTPSDSGTGDVTATPDPGSNSGDGSSSGDIPPGMDGQGTDMRDTAQGYVGQDMDSLVGQVGDANASEYGTDEETGSSIGYYYYDGFTVSTIEGEDGSQTVTGVW